MQGPDSLLLAPVEISSNIVDIVCEICEPGLDGDL